MERSIQPPDRSWPLDTRDTRKGARRTFLAVAILDAVITIIHWPTGGIRHNTGAASPVTLTLSPDGRPGSAC